MLIQQLGNQVTTPEDAKRTERVVFSKGMGARRDKKGAKDRG
jgi:hypothetical protein